MDYAISRVPKVLRSIEQGAKITDVAQIFDRSDTTQISFKDKSITDPAQLAGKKVGSWCYGNEWELFAGMQDAIWGTPTSWPAILRYPEPTI